MIGLFKRAAGPAPDFRALGAGMLALRAQPGALVPDGCTGVAFDRQGAARRIAARARIALAAGESAFCFHPGPYRADLVPCDASPELGLRLSFAIDSPDRRVAQQRFDLFLMSEAGDGVALDGIAAAMQAALRHELALGNLELPPCTSLDEWNAFRAGLNQLLYTRFGVTVEDCVPVDLGDKVDYAQMLLARAHAAPDVPPGAVPAKAVPDAPLADAAALRRLFLELPCVMGALRQAALPPGEGLFGRRQQLLQRLDHVSLSVSTMPALELAAPGRRLGAARQAARAGQSVLAAAALDEAWGLAARTGLAAPARMEALLGEADRIVANLERHVAARRLADGGQS